MMQSDGYSVIDLSLPLREILNGWPKEALMTAGEVCNAMPTMMRLQPLVPDK